MLFQKFFELLTGHVKSLYSIYDVCQEYINKGFQMIRKLFVLTFLFSLLSNQPPSDDTVLGFAGGTASALLAGGVMSVGGAVVGPSAAALINPTLRPAQ